MRMPILSRSARILFLLFSFGLILSSTSLTTLGQTAASLTPEVHLTLTAAQAKIDHYAAHESLRLVSEAQHLLDAGGDPEIATLLAIRAYRANSSSRSLELALRQILSRNNVLVGSIPYMPVAFTLDGQTILDDQLQLHERDSGRVVRTFEQINGPTGFVVVSPDRKYVLEMDQRARTYIWETATGKVIRSLSGQGVAFSADSQGILVAKRGQGLQLQAIVSGSLIRSFEDVTHKNADQELFRAIFSPDGRFLVTVDEDNSRYVIRVWDAASGQLIRRLGPAQDQGGLDTFGVVTVSPDSKGLVVAFRNQVAAIAYDLETGEPSAWYFDQQAEAPWLINLTFTPDGKYLFGSDYTGQMHVWDRQTGFLALRFRPGGIPIFSPDGQVFTVGGRLWKMPDLIRIIPQTSADFSLAPLSADGKYIVTPRVVFDAATQAQLYLIPNDSVTAASAISADSKFLILLTPTHGIVYLDLATGRQIKTLLPYGPEPPYLTRNVQFVLSPNDQWLLIRTEQGSAWLVNAITGAAVYDLAQPGNAAVDVAFSPDSHLAVVADAKAARLWDMTTGALLVTIEDQAGIRRATFSPNGRFVITAGESAAAKVWALPTTLVSNAPPVATYPPHFSPTPSFTPSRVLSHTPTTSITPTFGRPITYTPYPPGPTYTPRATTTPQMRFAPLYPLLDKPTRIIGPGELTDQAMFTPDGRSVVTRGGKLVKVWGADSGELERAYTEGKPLQNPDGKDVSISPDGRYLVVVSDGAVSGILSPGEPEGIYAIPFPSGIRPDIAAIPITKLIDYACRHVFRDLDADYRARYYIDDASPTCP